MSVWLRGSNNQNLKEIHELGTEIIATQTDIRMTDKVRFHDLC